MLQLYYDPMCGFCRKVLSHLDDEQISWEPKKISLWLPSENKRELVDLGGKAQVPFLVDSEKGVQMYESAEILDYLRANYTGQ